jgi:deoxyuridine 5'-triphosphate nucleotidohydrolase
MIILDVKLLEGARLPTRGTEDSAAFDLYAPADTLLYPQSFELIDLKLQVVLHKDTCGVISHRSGMNSRCGIFAYGLIDPDYRGNLKVTLYNFSDDQYEIKQGDRIAQLKIEQLPYVVIREVKDIPKTSRESGHGSTGR